MADITTTPQSLREQFASKAVLPAKQIEKAEAFITTVKELVAKGVTPSGQMIKEGKGLLRTVAEQTDVFLFNAAALVAQEAAQEAAPESDLDRRLTRFNPDLEKAQQTIDRLNATLDGLK